MFASSSTRAFTLFEVAISLTLMTVVILSTLLLLPVALRSQEQYRYKILASAKALEMIDAFNSFHNAVTYTDHEAPNAWDVHEAYRSQQPDLEVRLASFRFGLFPVPLDIARRLDSDNDEIKSLLDQGGYLYYSNPLAAAGLKEDAFVTVDQTTGTQQATNPATETQRLVIGIVGFAQNNALYALTQKTWPYYTAYPSPPMHVAHSSGANSYLPSGTYTFTWTGANNVSVTGYLWESVNGNDNDMLTLFKVYEQYQIATTPTQALAQAYCDAAVAYCQAKALSASTYDGVTVLNDFDTALTADKYYVEVNALRFLAHASNCLLHFTASGTSGGIAITQSSVTTMHDNCLKLGMLFQARYPYDWGSPRPVQHAIMMDDPLIEYDLGAAPLTGTIFGASTITAAQWRPISTQPIVHIGKSMDFPNFTPAPPSMDPAVVGSIWSADPTHSTLTAAFEPAERCRQIVFWAVDWQSYEDFETAPSAPVDASKYVKGAPFPGRSFGSCMTSVGFADRHQYMYRNPEKPILFNTDMSALATGTPTPVTNHNVAASATAAAPTATIYPGELGSDDDAISILDLGTSTTATDIFSGRWGADRNRNFKLDRGPVPKSVRMRAVQVARFNFYDPRLHAIVR